MIHSFWDSSAKAVQIMRVDYVTLGDFVGGERSQLETTYMKNVLEKREFTLSKGLVCYSEIEDINYFLNCPP